MALGLHNLTNKDLGRHSGYPLGSSQAILYVATWPFSAHSCAPTGRCWDLVFTEHLFAHPSSSGDSMAQVTIPRYVTMSPNMIGNLHPTQAPHTAV